MPRDHTVVPESEDEPRFTEDDLDAGVERVIDRATADDNDDLDELYVAGLIDGAQQVQRFLLRER